MIIRTSEYDEFCRRQLAEECLSHEEALRIFDALAAEALSLEAFTDENALEGLNMDLRIARAVNGLRQ